MTLQELRELPYTIEINPPKEEGIVTIKMTESEAEAALQEEIDAAIDNSRRLEKKWCLRPMDERAITAACKRYKKTGTFAAPIYDI